jgi:hypothetical protein
VARAIAGTGPAEQSVNQETAVYVYGFVRSGTLTAVDAEGVREAAPTLVDGDGVAAIVSPVDGAEIRLSRRDLRAHLRVIESAFAQTTILPCPFGTVVASADELETRVLAGARDDLLAGLARLDGTVQMNVKATYDEEELLRDIVAADPEVAALRERTRDEGDAAHYERLRLGEIVAARISERAAQDGDWIVGTLAANALDVVAEQPEPASAVRASFLVERSSLGRFDAALEGLAQGAQPLLGFEVIGPLPPTAFAAAYAAA